MAFGQTRERWNLQLQRMKTEQIRSSIADLFHIYLEKGWLKSLLVEE